MPVDLEDINRLLESNPKKCKGTLGYRAFHVIAWAILALLVFTMVIAVAVACAGCSPLKYRPAKPEIYKVTDKVADKVGASGNPTMQRMITLVWSNQEMWIGNQVESAARPDGPWQLYARMTNGTNFIVSFTVPATNGWRFYRVGAFRP